ncbi:MAG: UvrD-helicase domain-containing protein [Myxococcota bacterium]
MTSPPRPTSTPRPTEALADHAARERIWRDLNATLVVEAAAGTGKTTALVQRMVEVLRSGVAGLEQLVAVTFTEKAAGEMKLRLRAEIEEVRANAGPAERSRLDDALQRLETARISTIHSFCADLLRERPVEAGVDPDFEVVAEDSANVLLERAFDRWFQNALANPSEGLRRFLRRRPSSAKRRAALFGICGDLVERRDYPGEWARPPFDREGRTDALVDALRELGALREFSRGDRFLGRFLKIVERFVAEIDDRERVRRWGSAGDAAALHPNRDYDGLEAKLSELARTSNGWNARSGSFQGIRSAEVVQRRDAVREELEAFLRDADADLAAALHGALLPVVAAYEELKADAGVLDFLDLLVGARNLVRSSASVRRELQGRFTHLFVDEFQDTDPLQAELMLLLSADDPTEVDAEEARPVPGKLFVVGDPKQSIYRFRRADVGTYLQIKDRLLAKGAELLHLTTNFRSLPGIQAAINVSFAEAMESSAYQPAYVALDRYRPPRTGQPSVVALPVPRPYGDRGRIWNKSVQESTPDAVGAFVSYLIRESGWVVEDPARPGEIGPIAPRHVCLLFRQRQTFWRDAIRPYLRALEARQVPHLLSGGLSFYARGEVMAVRAALTAIEWPDDELHVYATLRGPFFALEDSALLLARAAAGNLHPLAPRPETEPGPVERLVFDALDLLRDLHRGRNQEPIADTIARFLEATRAYASIAHWNAGEEALANVLHLVSEARRFEAQGATSFRAFVEWLDRESRPTPPIASLEEDSEGVRVMTVHSAKGLEFPVVILCDPSVSRRKERPSRFVDHRTRTWLAPIGGLIPGELAAKKDEVIAADEAEEIRIGYVAATRARDLLVVPCVGAVRHPGWVDVLHRALYPKPNQWRAGTAGPGCPAFGEDSVFERPATAEDAPMFAVKPGLYRHLPEGEGVVWWDPHVLDLDLDAGGGIRNQELLVADDAHPEAEEEALRAVGAWEGRRAQAIAKGSTPSMLATPVTALSHARAAEGGLSGRPVKIVGTEIDRTGRPGGARFGTLVHAVLADVGGGAEGIRALAKYHGRALGATKKEVEHAVAAVGTAVAHPLFVRAMASADRRFEAPIHLPTEVDGRVMHIEGIIDLVFREDRPDGPVWVVVDFKTDDADEPHYREQVAIYCDAIETVTEEAAEGVLMMV